MTLPQFARFPRKIYFLPSTVYLSLFFLFTFTALNKLLNVFVSSIRGDEDGLPLFISAALSGFQLHSMNMLRIRHLITKYEIDSHFFKKSSSIASS